MRASEERGLPSACIEQLSGPGAPRVRKGAWEPPALDGSTTPLPSPLSTQGRPCAGVGGRGVWKECPQPFVSFEAWWPGGRWGAAPCSHQELEAGVTAPRPARPGPRPGSLCPPLTRKPAGRFGESFLPREDGPGRSSRSPPGSPPCAHPGCGSVPCSCPHPMALRPSSCRGAWFLGGVVTPRPHLTHICLGVCAAAASRAPGAQGCLVCE